MLAFSRIWTSLGRSQVVRRRSPVEPPGDDATPRLAPVAGELSDSCVRICRSSRGLCTTQRMFGGVLWILRVRFGLEVSFLFGCRSRVSLSLAGKYKRIACMQGRAPQLAASRTVRAICPSGWFGFSDPSEPSVNRWRPWSIAEPFRWRVHCAAAAWCWYFTHG